MKAEERSLPVTGMKNGALALGPEKEERREEKGQEEKVLRQTEKSW